PYADQIDVRGIWIDKVLATKYLFARTLEKEGSRSFDAIQDSYFDMEELRKEMLQLLQGFIFNNVSRPVKFTLINGQELEETLPVEVFKSHQIAKHFSPELTKTLNLPDRDFYFIEVMLNEVAQQKERTLAKKDIAKALVDFVGIHRSKAVNEGGK